MFDNLKLFLMKRLPSSPPLQAKKPKPTGYVNWENVGNDVNKLVNYLGKKSG